MLVLKHTDIKEFVSEKEKKMCKCKLFVLQVSHQRSQSSSITSGVKVSTDIDVFGVFNIHVYFGIQSSFIYRVLVAE